MQVIKPVDTCLDCQSQFKTMRGLKGMYDAFPENGAKGILEAAIEEYNQHHKEVHPVHPDAKQPQNDVVHAQGWLKEFPGIKVFGIVDDQGKALVNEGLVLAYKDRVLVMDVKEGKLEDYGTFIACFSSMTLEERCVEIWCEYFDGSEE